MLYKEEEIVAIVRSDIKHNIAYGNEYLVLTNKRLLVISEDTLVKDIPLKKINMASMKGNLGICVLVVDTCDGPKNVLYFSRTRKGDFKKVITLINDLTLNQIPVSEIKKYLGEILQKRQLSRNKRAILLRLLGFLRPFLHLVILTFTIAIISRVLSLLPPYLMAILIDKVLIPRTNFDLLVKIILALLGIHITTMLLNILSGYLDLKLRLGLTTSLRAKLYEKLQILSLSFYDKYSTGRIISRVSSDVNNINNFLVMGVGAMLLDVIVIISIGVILITLNPWLTLIALTPLPISLLGTAIYKKYASKYYHRLWKRWSDIVSLLSETVSAFILVKSFGKERRMVYKFRERLGKFIDANMDVFKYNQKIWPAIGLSFTISSLLIWWLGGLQVLQGTLTLGALTAFTSYMWSFYRPINDFFAQVRSIPGAVASGERIFEVLDLEPDVKENPKAKEIDIKGAIEFKDVWFTYDGIYYALRGVNLEIKPGEHIGVVGPSGSGKTTLVKLILRLYDPQRGKVLIDGIDIKDVKLESLKKQVAIVLQNPILFDTTIAENIALGKEDATLEEIIAAAKAANAHSFIMKLPEAYDTKVGSGGKRLSGGERQRIAIASAILKDPKILILDEPTSSLDAIAEKEVSEAIDNLTRGKTTIIIAHRLSTLRSVNKIIVLDRGAIVEEGTHEELLKRQGLYKKLFDAQFEGFVRPTPMPIRR